MKFLLSSTPPPADRWFRSGRRSNELTELFKNLIYKTLQFRNSIPKL